MQCLSILDVLLSLTNYVKNSEHVLCRPEVSLNESDNNMNPFIQIKNGYHPCLIKKFNGDYIPNDIIIGSQVS